MAFGYRTAAPNPAQVDRPVRHMSAGRWITSTRYIVGWPEDGFVKAGCTLLGRARYGKFLSLGAEVVDLAHYAEPMGSLQGERWLLRHLDENYPMAFSDRDDAIRHLPGGAGWTECFLVPRSEWPDLVAASRVIDGGVA